MAPIISLKQNSRTRLTLYANKIYKDVVINQISLIILKYILFMSGINYRNLLRRADNMAKPATGR